MFLNLIDPKFVKNEKKYKNKNLKGKKYKTS